MNKTYTIRKPLPELVSNHEVATDRTFAGRGTYTGADLKPVRSGADDHERVPSRMGDRLHYRDGRTEAAD